MHSQLNAYINAFSLECMQPVCEQTHVTQPTACLWTYRAQCVLNLYATAVSCDCDLFGVAFQLTDNCHDTFRTAEQKHAA